MNDTNQTPIPVPKEIDAATSSTSQPVDQPAMPLTPISQVGSMQKERVPPAFVETPVAVETVVPTEQAPEVSQEVADVGVEVHNEEPQLSPAHHQAGVFHGPSLAPIPEEPEVELPPFSAAEAVQVKKTTPVTNSKLWDITLLEKVWKVARELGKKVKVS